MSSPTDWCLPGHVPPPRPQPVDELPVLWTLRKDTRWIDAVWRLGDGYLGVEATLRRNGDLLRSQRFASPDEARAWLDARRADLEGCGWTATGTLPELRDPT